MLEDQDVTMEHPDLDQAVEVAWPFVKNSGVLVDDHGPAFPATLEGLDDVAEDQGMGGLDA
jgi:hypothetical protein